MFVVADECNVRIFDVYAARNERNLYSGQFLERGKMNRCRGFEYYREREREGRGKGCSSNLGRNRSDGACERSRHIGQGEHDS